MHAELKELLYQHFLHCLNTGYLLEKLEVHDKVTRSGKIYYSVWEGVSYLAPHRFNALLQHGWLVSYENAGLKPPSEY